jgi:peptide/nickel transport system ATP-binding protein
MKNNKNLVLDVSNLEVEYRTQEGVVHAVNGVDIKLPRKSTLGLVGETGAGKTTLALSIMRLVPSPPGVITGGSILLDGQDIFSLKDKQMEKIRGKDVAMIFQDPMTSLNPILTVGEQISEVIRLHENVSQKQAEARVKEMLELVGIDGERMNEYPHQFSGGMQQRVMIAIGLVCNPKLLIADEPTTALDVTIQAQVLDLMRGLKDEFDMSMIMITHSLGIVAEVCDYVSVMYGGRIVEYGSVRDVFKNTKHPYTEGLFNSIPIINAAKRLEPIPGLMPDPIELPTGCVFWPRCSYAIEECKKDVPQPKYFNDTHYASCIRYEEPDFKLKGR